MNKILLLILAVCNAILFFLSIPMTGSIFAEIGINANYDRVMHTLTSTNISEIEKQQMKSSIEFWRNSALLESKKEETNRVHLRLLIAAYVVLCTGLIFYIRKKI